jgi:hypothetical protein
MISILLTPALTGSSDEKLSEGKAVVTNRFLVFEDKLLDVTH